MSLIHTGRIERENGDSQSWNFSHRPEEGHVLGPALLLRHPDGEEGAVLEEGGGGVGSGRRAHVYRSQRYDRDRAGWRRECWTEREREREREPRLGLAGLWLTERRVSRYRHTSTADRRELPPRNCLSLSLGGPGQRASLSRRFPPPPPTKGMHACLCVCVCVWCLGECVFACNTAWPVPRLFWTSFRFYLFEANFRRRSKWSTDSGRVFFFDRRTPRWTPSNSAVKRLALNTSASRLQTQQIRTWLAVGCWIYRHG